MAYFGTDPEALLLRTTVVSAALQALIGRLACDGVLDKGDLIAMREVGMQLAADLGEQLGRDNVAAQMGREVETWWDAAESLAGE